MDIHFVDGKFHYWCIYSSSYGIVHSILCESTSADLQILLSGSGQGGNHAGYLAMQQPMLWLMQ